MASPENRHCAYCIGALSFAIGRIQRCSLINKIYLSGFNALLLEIFNIIVFRCLSCCRCRVGEC